MGVQRHDELRAVDVCPHAEIDSVLSDHPSQIEIEPLARAAVRRPGKELGHPLGGHTHTTDRREIDLPGRCTKRVQGGPDVGRVRGIPAQKELFQ